MGEVIGGLEEWKWGKGKVVVGERGKVIVCWDEENEVKGEGEMVGEEVKEMFGWE